MEGFSHEIAALYPDRFFDYVWIDAAHDYENVKRDIESWYPKLKSGGVLFGHDYPEPTDPNGGFEELTKAVNETVRDDRRFGEFGWFCGVWGARKL
jgi:predicted TIM-barrel fold metal-dependent hydrolase